MRNGFKGMVVALGVVAMMAAGCAKEEVVKKDEPVVQQQTVKQQEPVKQVEPVKQEEQQKAAPKQEEGTAAKASAAVALETVYFDFDKSDLRKDSRDVLSKNAEALLKQVADAKIQVAGHCDERGSDEYNLALGERRAKSVAKYLTTLGVKADRISTISYGKEKPAVQGSDEAAWSKNRRAEFVIVK
ncbi:peptidoglycan-associated lipoprotein [Trichlorobacter thiogenes]|uniref:Peptidoglycan-associated lipoprotein n=1 Tax=Trichlorobacter thiogenes TaxID=115783 RepID=A0A1T4JZN5_9BACT|nr:peptidoglycan-associated lipoprotein Pal [Trichlorobacter thiogenes]SJZ35495.1 peptidoglycan-associated lipoprotein [Trichlorobacter thiogenes]